MDWRFWTRKHHSQDDTCASLEPLLSLYSDGMASPEEARRVESHLSACADCQRALQWMEATRQVISKRPAVEPSANLRLRIAQAIAEAEQAKAPSRPAARPLVLRPASLAMAAAASFALVGILLIEHSPTPSPAVSPVAVRPLPSLPTPPTVARSAKTPPKTSQVATNKVSGSHHHAGNLPFPEAHRTVAHTDRMANAVGGAETEALTKTAPIVRPLPAVAAKKSQEPSARLAALKPTASVRPKIRRSIDKTLREAVKPSAPPAESVVPAPTLEANNTSPSENLIPTPSAPPVEVSVPVVAHPMRVDALTGVRAHLASFQQDEHRSIKVTLDTSARTASSAGTQFVMLPTVYSPTILSKSPSTESR